MVVREVSKVFGELAKLKGVAMQPFVPQILSFCYDDCLKKNYEPIVKECGHWLTLILLRYVPDNQGTSKLKQQKSFILFSCFFISKSQHVCLINGPLIMKFSLKISLLFCVFFFL